MDLVRLTAFCVWVMLEATSASFYSLNPDYSVFNPNVPIPNALVNPLIQTIPSNNFPQYSQNILPTQKFPFNLIVQSPNNNLFAQPPNNAFIQTQMETQLTQTPLFPETQINTQIFQTEPKPPKSQNPPFIQTLMNTVTAQNPPFTQTKTNSLIFQNPPFMQPQIRTLAAQNPPFTQTQTNPLIFQNPPFMQPQISTLAAQNPPFSLSLQNYSLANTIPSPEPPTSPTSVLEVISISGYDQISTCFYVNLQTTTSSNQQVPLLTYVSGEATEITFQLEYDRQVSSLSIGSENPIFLPIIPPSNQWTHICFTWNGKSGLLKAYADGLTTLFRQEVQVGYKISKDGVWNIPELQDDIGIVTQLHFWDRVISDVEVNQVLTCSLSGNILSWDASQMGFNEILTSFAENVYPCSKPELEPEPEPEETCADHPTTSVLDLPELNEDEAFYVMGYFDKIFPKLRDFSVCAWFYIEEYFETGPLKIVDPDGELTFQIVFWKDGTVSLGMSDGKDFDQRELKNIEISYYHWQHYCITWTRDIGKAMIYVNGNRKHVEKDLMPGLSLAAGSELRVYQVQYDVPDSDNPTYGFGFKTTDVNWWNYVLTEDEVVEVYSCSGSLSGNFLSWYNDEFMYYDDWLVCDNNPATTSFLDMSEFSGSSLESVAAAASQNIPDLQEMSMCAWINVLYDGECYGLMDQEASSNSFDFIGLYTCPDDGYYFEVGSSDSKWATGVIAPIGEWQYVCATWEGSSGETMFYINGELQAQTTYSASDYIQKGTVRLFQMQAGQPDEDDPLENFATKITEFNLWSYALTEDEVSDAYCGNAYGDLINEDTEWNDSTVGTLPHNYD